MIQLLSKKWALLFLVLFYATICQSQTQNQTVTGTVTDENGIGIPGVNVIVKEKNRGVVTDFDGNYAIEVQIDDTLIFSFIGTKTVEQTVGKMNTYNITMVPDQAMLDEVVVVGYGTQKKENLTGSIASVSGEALEDRPVPNASNLIQGRVTGLQVTQPSGEPGRDNPDFLIRGRGSFGASNNPLILIDGVSGSLNNLSPDNIENITVLKDAASASIYGSRAANGVILVTTKKGQKGKSSISYRINTAIHSPTTLPNLITNSADYMELYNQAAERSGVAFRYDQEDIQRYRHALNDPQYPNFNSLDYYFNAAPVINHSLSISGGSEKSSYNVSLGYLDQQGMIKGYEFNRYNALLNYSNQITDHIKVGTSMKMTYKDRKEPPFTGEGMALSIYAAGPLYGPFLPDGTGRIVSRAYQSEGRNRNPQEYYAMGNQRTKDYNLNAQAYVEIEPIKNLKWTTKFAVDYLDGFYKMHQQNYDAYLLQERDESGDYKRSTFGPDVIGVTDDYSKFISPTIYSTLTYEKTFNTKHNFDALLGYEQVSYKSQGLRGRRTNSAFGSINELLGYSPEDESLFFSHPRLPGITRPSEWALLSFFGRVNYNYDGKYLLEGNLRYDGSSRLSPNTRWDYFPSFSAGWVASKENFLKDVDWINTLKLRLSYGTLGNQNIGNYLYQNRLAVNDVNYSFNNQNLHQGAALDVFRDQGLKWESTRMVDFGVDFMTKNQRFGFVFDYFKKKTYDILATQPVPGSLGLGAPTVNDGEMVNKGVELELIHRNTIGKFSYDVNFLVSKIENELTHIRVPNYGSRIREEGLPYDSHYLYEWDGIFQEADITNPNVPNHELNPNPTPGDLKMVDQNGDGVVDQDDRIVVSGAYPDFTYSFGFNASYENFKLSVFFQGVAGVKTRLENWGVDPFMQGTPPTEKWRNAWTPQNPTNELPAIYIAGYSGVDSYKASTYYLQDAAYLRLKNISLSYAIPDRIASALRTQRIELYASADNLLTITDFEGGDPERASLTGNLAQYPQARIVNLGLNVQF